MTNSNWQNWQRKGIINEDCYNELKLAHDTRMITISHIKGEDVRRKIINLKSKYINVTKQKYTQAVHNAKMLEEEE